MRRPVRAAPGLPRCGFYKGRQVMTVNATA